MSEGLQNLYNAVNGISQQISAIIGTLTSTAVPVLMTPALMTPSTTQTFSSAAGVWIMAGMGSTCTLHRPSSAWVTGRFRIDFAGYWENPATNLGLAGRIYYGAGAAPSSGAAPPGSAMQLGADWYMNAKTALSIGTFSRGVVLVSSGASSYWFDLAINYDAGAGAQGILYNPQFTAQEI